MRILSPDAINEKKKSLANYYVIGIVGGLLAAGIFIGTGKLFGLIVRFLIKYWILTLAIVAGLLVMRKLFGKKKIEIREVRYEDPYR